MNSTPLLSFPSSVAYVPLCLYGDRTPPPPKNHRICAIYLMQELEDALAEMTNSRDQDANFYKNKIKDLEMSNADDVKFQNDKSKILKRKIREVAALRDALAKAESDLNALGNELKRKELELTELRVSEETNDDERKKALKGQ